MHAGAGGRKMPPRERRAIGTNPVEIARASRNGRVRKMTRAARSAPEQGHRNRRYFGAQVFTQALRLRIAAQRRRDAVAEQPLEHEIQRQQVRELEAVDVELACLGQQLA
jgi:hypothetical protein